MIQLLPQQPMQLSSGGPDLASLAAPPPTLQQPQVSQALPDASYGAPPSGFAGLMHGLLTSFNANPQVQAQAPLNAPGIAGLFPEGSGVQNLVGRLWDAHLMHEGQSPIFNQWQQNAAMGQAEQPLLQNGAFDQNGNISDAAHQALSNLARVNPEAAQTMQGQLINSQIARMNMQREINVSQADIAAKQAETQDKARGAARALLSSANAANYPIIKDRANAILQKNGVDPAELSLPDTYDADAIRQIQLGSVPVARQLTINEKAEHDRQLENIGHQNANAHSGIAQAALANVGNNAVRAGATASIAGTDAARLQNDILGGKTGPNTVHGGGAHHVFGGAATAVAPPPFPPGRPNRTVTNGTHVFYSPDGKNWIPK